ncbi:MAG: hypothetical protein AB1489_43090 [Acidobacteriota bacterium]
MNSNNKELDYQAQYFKAVKIVDELLCLLILGNVYDDNYRTVQDALKEIAIAKNDNPQFPITIRLANILRDKGLIED